MPRQRLQIRRKEVMHMVRKRARVAAKRDIISNLPDDMIHHILSCLDLKYAIQTSVLSRNWKNMWTSVLCLKFDSRWFQKLPKFAKFVKQTLSHHNNHSQVYAVDLKFTGLATQSFVKSIVKYAYARNVRKMAIVWFTRKEDEALPEIVFRSQSLKHLTIAVNNPRPFYGGLFGTTFLKSTWEFPALETLKLSGMRLGPCKGNFNFFSNCENLKDLTLNNVSMYYCDTLHVCPPNLCNLTITDIPAYPKVLHVVAPKLKKLTASISACGGWCSVDFLQLSTKDEGLSSLEEVNLSKSNENDDKEDRNFPRLLDLFEKLSNAKFLTLDMDIIQTLSSHLDQLSCEPRPFQNLESVKINTSRLQHTDPIPTIPRQVRNYLLDNSPNATFIIN